VGKDIKYKQMQAKVGHYCHLPAIFN